MQEFKATYRYYLYWIIGIFLISGCFFAALLEYLAGRKSTSLLVIAVIFLILYFLVFFLPREIVIRKNGLVFKSSLISRKIDFDKIKNIKYFQSTKSLIWHGGDREKAPMLCIVTLCNRPFGFLLFGHEISGHKELYSLIRNRIEAVKAQNP